MNKEIKGLNGLRAVAVILVLIYHFYPNLLPGGFLGVDLFFVLSGFLITSILLNKKVDILNFYYRRFKRLLPLSFFMLIMLIIILGFTNHDWLIKERINILNSFIYNLNLHNVLSKANYFDSFDIVSPVKHLWSLAIEMKFYILFPFLFLITTDKKKLRIIFISLIILSIATSAFIYLSNKNSLNIIYNLLITRMYAILIGSLFATYIDLNMLRDRKSNIIGYILLILTIISMIFLNENSIYEYQIVYFFSIIFGFTLIFLANSKLLEPLNYLGNISYGIYIFHFAVISLTTPFEEYAEPNILYVILRVILTVLLSMFTYHFIENPIRINGFKDFFQKPINFILSCTLTIIAIIMLLGLNLEIYPYRLISKEDVGANILKLDLSKINIEENSKDIKNNIEIPKETKNITKNNEINPKTNSKLNIGNNIYKKVLLIGDSVGINVSQALLKVVPYLEVDAQTGRFFFDSIKIADKYKEYNANDSAVIIILGNNGPIKRKDIDVVVSKFNNADIYLVNTNIPRSWNNSVNSTLEEATNEIENAYLIDWQSTSLNHREYFRKDRVHVNEKGAEAFIKLIKNTLKKDIDINSERQPKLHIEHQLRNKTHKKQK